MASRIGGGSSSLLCRALSEKSPPRACCPGYVRRPSRMRMCPVRFRFPSVLPRFPTTGPRSRSCTRRRARRCIMPNGRGNGSALFTGNCLSLAPRLERNDRLIYSYAGGGFRLTGGILFYIRKVRESRAAGAPPTPPGSKESNGNGCSPGVRLSKSASPRVCAFRLRGYRRKGGRHESGMCRRVCVGSGH